MKGKNSIPKNIMDYEFETTTTNDKGEQKKEKHKLKEFAKLKEGTSIATINRKILLIIWQLQQWQRRTIIQHF